MRGKVTVVKARAREIASSGVDDDAIWALLLDEFATVKPYKVPRRTLRTAFDASVRNGELERARVAGRARILDSLRKEALEGDTGHIRARSAIALVRRMEQMEGLEEGVRRELQRLLDLDPGELAAELERLGSQLGAHR